MSSTDLTSLNWQPAILLKVVRVPFANWGGLSLKRVYLALRGEQLLYADWTLEAAERSDAVVCSTGWSLAAPLTFPLRLQGKGMHIIPSGTWALPYTDSLFTLYGTVNHIVASMSKRIDQQPTDPVTLSMLIRLSQRF